MFGKSGTIRELRDDHGYRAGKDGSFKQAHKTGMLFKAAFSAETVKKQNQKALGALMQQLLQQYASDSFDTSRATPPVPMKVLFGKRGIPGKKTLASVRAINAPKVQEASGPLVAALKKALGRENPTPGDMLQAITMNTPRKGSSQIRRTAFRQAIAALSREQYDTLQTIMFSECVVQAQQLLDEAIAQMTGIGENTDTEVCRLRARTAGVLLPVQDSLVLTRQTVIARGRKKGYPCPQPPVSRPADWDRPNPEALKLLDAIGLGRVILAKMALRDILPLETHKSFLGRDAFAIRLLRSMGSEKLYGPLKEIEVRAKEAILADFDTLKNLFGVSAGGLPAAVEAQLTNKKNPTPQFNARLMKPILDAMVMQPEFKKSLAECVAFMRQHIEPLVRDTFGARTPELLRSGFHALFSVGSTRSLAREIAAIRDEKTRAAMTIANTIVQLGMSEAFLTPDQPFGRYMETVPGWKDMTTVTEE